MPRAMYQSSGPFVAQGIGGQTFKQHEDATYAVTMPLDIHRCVLWSVAVAALVLGAVGTAHATQPCNPPFPTLSAKYVGNSIVNSADNRHSYERSSDGRHWTLSVIPTPTKPYVTYEFIHANGTKSGVLNTGIVRRRANECFYSCFFATNAMMFKSFEEWVIEDGGNTIYSSFVADAAWYTVAHAAK